MRVYIFILIIFIVLSKKNIQKSKFYLVRTGGGIEGKNQQLKKTALSMNDNMMKDIEGDVQKKLEKVDDKKDRD